MEFNNGVKFVFILKVELRNNNPGGEANIYKF